MTDTEMRIAIAEACGWKFVMSKERHVWDLYRPDKTWAISDDTKASCVNCSNTSVPDYPNDLNAIRDAEMRLSESQNFSSAFQLCRIVGFDYLNFDNNSNIALVALVNATARQRCEAFLRTLNLWIEETK